MQEKEKQVKTNRKERKKHKVASDILQSIAIISTNIFDLSLKLHHNTFLSMIYPI